MSDIDSARNSAWYALSPPEGAPDRDVFNRGFDAGARWAIRYSSQLSPYLAKLVELVIVLGFVDQEEA